MILADFLLPGSGSASLIGIREAKIMRIRPDPDPHHCFEQSPENQKKILPMNKQKTYNFIVAFKRLLLYFRVYQTEENYKKVHILYSQKKQLLTHRHQQAATYLTLKCK